MRDTTEQQDTDATMGQGHQTQTSGDRDTEQWGLQDDTMRTMGQHPPLPLQAPVDDQAG
jgi:hypothetical protein